MQEQFAKAAEIIISIILFHNVIQFILLYALNQIFIWSNWVWIDKFAPTKGNGWYALYNIHYSGNSLHNNKTQKSRRCLLMTKGAANSQIIDYSFIPLGTK